MRRVLMALFMLVLVVFIWRSPLVEAVKQCLARSEKNREVLRMLNSLPVRELILQEATFDVITMAEISEEGNPILYFVSAGMLGKNDDKQVLFRGCVRIRFGIDLDIVNSETCSIRDGMLVLQLPLPRMIGNPVILTEPPFESRILDVKGEGWWAGYVERAEVQTQIHQEYAKHAAKLCEGLDLENKTMNRAEQVFQAFLEPLLKDKGLDLRIEWMEEPVVSE